MSEFYDIHCHVFNKNVLIRRLVSVVQVLVDIVEEEGSVNKNERLKLVVQNFNDLLQPDSEDVFQVLDEAYNHNFTVTPLMLDLTYADDNDGREGQDRRYRRRIDSIFDIIRGLLRIAKFKFRKDAEMKALIAELILKVKAFDKQFKVKSKEEVQLFDDANYTQQLVELTDMANKYDNFKPFYCVDPRRQRKDGKNILQELEEHILNGPFVGVKMYAPVGFSPTDPILMGKAQDIGVYGWCVKHNIPITVHCSNSGFACLSRHLKVFGHINIKDRIFAAPAAPYKFDVDFFALTIKFGEAIHERAYTLNHPKLWEKVLRKHPNLTLNLAHMGGATQIMKFVNYELEQTEFRKPEFEEMLSLLNNRDRKTVESAFKKRGRKRLYKDDEIDLTKRRAVWNILYKAGFNDNWAKAIFDIIRNPKYPNAFSDLSCFSVGDWIVPPGSSEKIYTIEHELADFKTNVYDHMTDYEKSKILYGSDYFLIHFFGAKMERYVQDFQKVFGEEFKDIAKSHPERFLGV